MKREQNETNDKTNDTVGNAAKHCLPVLMVLILCIAAAAPCFGQFREYYIYGKVVDNGKQPINGAEIALRENSTSRSYSFKSNKKGKFKFVGLPHGIYEATIKKEGYKTMSTTWDLSTPQNRMQKVDLGTVVMISQEKLQEIQLNKDLGARFEKAKQLIQTGDIDGALKKLQTILDKKPDEENALYLKGICLIRKEAFTEAAEALKIVIRKKPDFVGAYYQLGVCYQKLKELEKALNFYGKALELEPGNFVSIFNSGLIHYSLKQYDDAIGFFQKALKQKADDAEIMELTGLSYLHKEKYPKALEYIEKAKNAYEKNNPTKAKELEELIKGLKEQTK